MLLSSNKFVTKLLQSYYRVITKLLQSYYKVITKLLQSYYKVITKLLQSYYKVITKLLQSYYKVITKLLQSYLLATCGFLKAKVTQFLSWQNTLAYSAMEKLPRQKVFKCRNAYTIDSRCRLPIVSPKEYWLKGKFSTVDLLSKLDRFVKKV